MIRLIVRAGVAISVFSSVLAAQNPAPPAPPTAPPPSAPVVVPTARTAAQDAAAKAGKVLSNSEIANAIKSSGLSETQVRARLQAGGFDAKLADPFFSVGGGAQPSGGTPAAPADPSFVNALQALGIINTEVADQDKKNADTDAEKRNVAELNAGGGGVFGKSIFSGSSSAFDPVSAGPVDPSYRLGVGDQLQYVVTGDMEMALGLEVRRDGSVILPQIGQVQVAGLTLDAARTLLSARAGRVYSLINSGKAHIDLAVSRVRTNQVYVIGEVQHRYLHVRLGDR